MCQMNYQCGYWNEPRFILGVKTPRVQRRTSLSTVTRSHRWHQGSLFWHLVFPLWISNSIHSRSEQGRGANQWILSKYRHAESLTTAFHINLHFPLVEWTVCKCWEGLGINLKICLFFFPPLWSRWTNVEHVPCLVFTWPMVVHFVQRSSLFSLVSFANSSPRSMPPPLTPSPSLPPSSTIISLHTAPANCSARWHGRLLAQPPWEQLPLSPLWTHPGFELVAGTQTWGTAPGGARYYAASDL